MVAPLPLQKILVVAIKQLVKPAAKLMVAAAETNTLLRTWILAPIGQSSHKVQVTCLAWQNNQKKPQVIAPLTEKRAVQTGADLFLYVVVIGLLAVIYLYDDGKAAEKKKKHEEKLATFRNDLDLFAAKVKEKSNRMGEIDTKLTQMDKEVRLMETKKL